MTAPLPHVGFLGLGIMGSRMARSLRRKGFAVTAWNRTRSRAEALLADGVEVAATPREVAERAEVVCTCVADVPALREVCLGADGVLAGARAGQLLIDFSTVSPELTRELEQACAPRGVDFVEAPVTGSKLGAQNATLVLMVGGADEAVRRATPLFEAVGSKWIHVGGVGDASYVKLAGNAVIASMLQGFSEAMLFVRRAGVDPRKLLEVVQASGFRSPYWDFKGKQLLERDFDTHFSIDLMFKDLAQFLETGARIKTTAPVVAAAKEVYAMARAHGLGERDIAATVCVLEDTVGARISPD